MFVLDTEKNGIQGSLTTVLPLIIGIYGNLSFEIVQLNILKSLFALSRQLWKWNLSAIASPVLGIQIKGFDLLDLPMFAVQSTA